MTAPTLTSPPTPAPNKFGGDPVAFDDAMQDRLDWQDTNVTEMTTALGWVDTQVSDVASKATTATTQATSATASAAAALVSANNAAADAGAALWVSGTTYALYVIVRSPLNSQTYKRVVAGAGTTDPSLDTTNWAPRLFDVSTTLPLIRPTLNLDFANSKAVDGRITFTRASTATRTNANGLIEAVASGVPRIDYDPVTLACKGLLIEEARTNLLTYSEDFSNAAWSKTRASVTANAVAAPDGTTTADKLVEDSTASNTHCVYQHYIKAASPIAYAATVYVKAAERTTVRFGVYGGTSGRSTADFDLSAGTVGATTDTGGFTLSSASIVAVADGFYRCTVLATTNSDAAVDIQLSLMSGGSDTYTGNGTSGIYVWGAQLETGSATSYIPTVAAQVTRAADVATMTGANFSSWYRADEGALLVNGSMANNVSTGFPIFALVHDTTANNLMQIVANGSGDVVNAEVRVGGVTQSGFYPAYVSGPVKVALTYKANDVNGAKDGTAGTTDTVCTIPTVSQLNVGCGTGGVGQINGHIARIAYYPKRLTNAELQAITA